MLILSGSNISKSYGIDQIIEDVSFSVNKGDRIGIVGPNGAGKSTLMGIIAGQIEPTTGNVYKRSEYSLGYLTQNTSFSSDGTVIGEAEKSFSHLAEMERELERMQELISDHSRPDFERNLDRYTHMIEEYENMGGYTYKSELRAVLAAMGFGEEYYDKKISMLSGGERTRLALSCMLLQKPDILMLDEPTNHLDLGMLAWLESYLLGFGGTILVVSHDRFFLDRIVNRIFDMHDMTLTAYKGNYSEYLVKREERLEAQLKEYEKQQKEIARQEEIIRRFKQHNTEHLVKRAQSREKRLAHIKVLEKPKGPEDKMKLSFGQDYKSGNDVIIAEGLTKSFGERKLFSNVNLDIKKGERVCIIGDNGTGKTTLLKMLIGAEPIDDGYLKIGYNVDFGYYDQGQQLLDDNGTVLGEMKNAYHLYTDTQMRSILGRFLFRGDDVFKTVGTLSGGEKAKLSLLKLMLGGSNTLVFDEPTNHLDIDSKEVIEAAISEFEGTVIIVSHDRYLLSKLPDRILELTRDGIVEYKGRFDYYLEKKEAMRRESEAAAGGDGPGTGAGVSAGPGGRRAAGGSGADATDGLAGQDKPLSSEDERKLRKQQEAEERRTRRRIEELEERISSLEEMIAASEAALCSPDNMERIEFLHEESERLTGYQQELEEVYDEWMELQ